MPFIRSSVSKHRALLATSISLNREIISLYSYITGLAQLQVGMSR